MIVWYWDELTQKEDGNVFDWLREHWLIILCGLFSGAGVALFQLVARKVRNRASGLSLTCDEEQSVFYRRVAHHEYLNTLISPRLRIRSYTSEAITIVRYRINILSPLRHKAEVEPSSVVPGTRVFDPLAENKGVWLEAAEMPVHVSAAATVERALFFIIPIVVPREAKELTCKLKIWDGSNRRASCKIKLRAY